jgi:sec-independent protein translocase protein TatB
MVREAELEDMEKQWKAQNEEIMRRSAALTTEVHKAEAHGSEAGAPVMTGPPPLDNAPFDKPATEPAVTPLPPLPVVPHPPPVRPATVTLGGHAIDPEPDTPREPMLPARPHTGEDDV